MSRFLFPVGLFYQSQGDSLLEFLDSHSWKLRVAEGFFFAEEFGKLGNVWISLEERRLCAGDGVRCSASIRKAASANEGKKVNDHELSELINTMRRTLRFTRKEVFVRISAICK